MPLHNFLKYRDYISAFEQSLSGLSHNIYTLGKAGLDDMVAFEIPNNPEDRIAIFGPVHWSEPSGAAAILEIIPFLPKEFSYILFPTLNPSGYESGIRKNAEDIDLNHCYSRDLLADPPNEVRNFIGFMKSRRFKAVISLHEDDPEQPEPGYENVLPPEGVYLFQEGGDQFLGFNILNKMKEAGVLITGQEEVYDDPCVDGLCYCPGVDCRHEDSFEKHILGYTPNVFVPEPPGYWGMSRKIETQKIFINSCLEAFRYG
jgi:hypothetical protein